MFKKERKRKKRKKRKEGRQKDRKKKIVIYSGNTKRKAEINLNS